MNRSREQCTYAVRRDSLPFTLGYTGKNEPWQTEMASCIVNSTEAMLCQIPRRISPIARGPFSASLAKSPVIDLSCIGLHGITVAFSSQEELKEQVAKYLGTESKIQVTQKQDGLIEVQSRVGLPGSGQIYRWNFDPDDLQVKRFGRWICREPGVESWQEEREVLYGENGYPAIFFAKKRTFQQDPENAKYVLGERSTIAEFYWFSKESVNSDTQYSLSDLDTPEEIISFLQTPDQKQRQAN